MSLTDLDDLQPASGSRQAALIAFQVIFVSVSLLVYSLRAFTRAVILRSIGSDDYIMGFAMLLSIGLCINACLSTQYGWGLHLVNIPPQNIPNILLSIWISELLFTLATSLAKISILIFYLRLAVTKTYRRVIYASIGFIIVWGIVFTFIVVFQCQPASDYWNPTARNCFPPRVAFFIHGLTNSITDVYIYILPMRMVWNIRLPKKQRLGLLAIFGAGFLVCVAGALRLYYSIETDTSVDTPWEGYYLTTWESIEINLGIVCASAPYLKALLTRLVPRLFTSGTASASAGAPYPERHKKIGAGSRYWRRNEEGGYVLESVERVGEGRSGDGESQSDLTDMHEHVLVAKVDINPLGQSPFLKI